jgi:hypothetical protein
MDLLSIIAELREEWQRLTDAIVALERLPPAGKRGRLKVHKSLLAPSPKARKGPRRATTLDPGPNKSELPVDAYPPAQE